MDNTLKKYQTPTWLEVTTELNNKKVEDNQLQEVSDFDLLKTQNKSKSCEDENKQKENILYNNFQIERSSEKKQKKNQNNTILLKEEQLQDEFEEYKEIFAQSNQNNFFDISDNRQLNETVSFNNLSGQKQKGDYNQINNIMEQNKNYQQQYDKFLSFNNSDSKKLGNKDSDTFSPSKINKIKIDIFTPQKNSTNGKSSSSLSPPIGFSYKIQDSKQQTQIYKNPNTEKLLEQDNENYTLYSKNLNSNIIGYNINENMLLNENNNNINDQQNKNKIFQKIENFQHQQQNLDNQQNIIQSENQKIKEEQINIKIEETNQIEQQQCSNEYKNQQQVSDESYENYNVYDINQSNKQQYLLSQNSKQIKKQQQFDKKKQIKRILQDISNQKKNKDLIQNSQNIFNANIKLEEDDQISKNQDVNDLQNLFFQSDSSTITSQDYKLLEELLNCKKKKKSQKLDKQEVQKSKLNSQNIQENHQQQQQKQQQFQNQQYEEQEEIIDVEESSQQINHEINQSCNHQHHHEHTQLLQNSRDIDDSQLQQQQIDNNKYIINKEIISNIGQEQIPQNPTVYDMQDFLVQQEQKKRQVQAYKKLQLVQSVKNCIDEEIKIETFCKCSEKAKCIKDYCACFKAGLECNSKCICTGCHNNNQNEARNQILMQRHKTEIKKMKKMEKLKRIKQDLENQIMQSFSSKQKYTNQEHERQMQFTQQKIQKYEGNKGQIFCTCKKSGCIKKYCECFKAGVSCTDACECVSCENIVHKQNMTSMNSQNQYICYEGESQCQGEIIYPYIFIDEQTEKPVMKVELGGNYYDNCLNINYIINNYSNQDLYKRHMNEHNFQKKLHQSQPIQ